MPKSLLFRKQQLFVLAPMLALALAACTSQTGNLNPTPATPSDKYIRTLEIKTTDKQSDIEKQYDGKIIVWHPESGFAILTSNQETPTLQGTTSNSLNINTVSLPEANALGYAAWAGGYSAWAGGYSAWAGGYSAWAGGEKVNNTFAENQASWNLIRLPEAYARAPHLGAKVRVAVIDTGIDLTHPAFTGRLAPATKWRDLVDTDTTPQETGDSNQPGYGHGTSVAGTILQIAPNAIILPLRVLDASGKGDTDKVARAMDWAIQQSVDVINLSLGVDTDTDAINKMIRYARSLNIFVVASSGNTGDTNMTYPAQHGPIATNLVSVGSVNSTGKKSSFTSYGPNLELLAPGENILGPAPDNQRSMRSGTSMAAPVITGLLSLALGETATDRPNLAENLINTAQLTEAQTANPGTSSNNQLGHGYPNARLFLETTLP